MMAMTYKKIIASLLAILTLNGCSFFGRQGVDITPYAVSKSEGPFEIRQYKPFVVARTTVTGDYDTIGSIGFNRLFRYISGDNQKQSKIAMTKPVLRSKEAEHEKISMTAPVLMTQQAEQWTMAFVLPRSYRLKTAPVPLNPDVRLDQVPGRKVAVILFSGPLNAVAIAEKTHYLKNWIAERKYKPIGSPIIAGYDPPWTIPMYRRNEIQIAIE